MTTMSNKTRNRTQIQGVKLLAESQMSWSTIDEIASSARRQRSNSTI
nr:MAG TPA: bacterial regulatory protein [Caudoviricetes sp.]